MRLLLQQFYLWLRGSPSNDYTIFPYLLPYVTPYGSRVYGGYTRQSDLDLFVSSDDSTTVKQLLQEHLVLFSVNSHNHYILPYISYVHNGFRINITIIPPSSVHAYHVATHLCIEYFKLYGTSPKSFRVHIFENFRDLALGERPSLLSHHRELVQTYYPELLI